MKSIRKEIKKNIYLVPAKWRIDVVVCTVFPRLFNLLDIYAVFPFLNIYTYIGHTFGTNQNAEIKCIKKCTYCVEFLLSFLKPMIHITNLYNLSKANRFFCIARIPKVISTSWYMCGCVYMCACVYARACVRMCVYTYVYMYSYDMLLYRKLDTATTKEINN